MSQQRYEERIYSDLAKPGADRMALLDQWHHHGGVIMSYRFESRTAPAHAKKWNGGGPGPRRKREAGHNAPAVAQFLLVLVLVVVVFVGGRSVPALGQDAVREKTGLTIDDPRESRSRRGGLRRRSHPQEHRRSDILR